MATKVATHRVMRDAESTDIEVRRVDDHHYEIGFADELIVIPFQSSDPLLGMNGLTMEALLYLVGDRLDRLQAGEFPCAENQRALGFVEQALLALSDRTARLQADADEPAGLPAIGD